MIELGIFTVQRLDKLQSNLGQSAQILKTLKKLHINGSVLKTFLPYYLKHTLMMTNV